jgi:cyclophilin family peptidyl-prolyl cis-trans isomerase
VSGSQFFIVTSENALQALDQAGNYPRFGRVTEGLELAAEMASNGDSASNGAPTKLYVIRSITITEG